MSKVISAHAVSVNGYISGRTRRLLEVVAAPGVTHLHYEVVR